MADRSAALPQVIDEQFVADLIRDLQVVGTLGVLNVSDGIVPVYLLGQRTAFQFEAQDPFYAAGEVFSAGEQTNPAANFVLADTVALPVGTYDLIATIGQGGNNGLVFRFQHRNAANAADINTWMVAMPPEDTKRYRFALTIAASERFRVLNVAAPGAGVLVQASIEARIRA